jgi:hypothetical protein
MNGKVYFKILNFDLIEAVAFLMSLVMEGLCFQIGLSVLISFYVSMLYILVDQLTGPFWILKFLLLL